MKKTNDVDYSTLAEEIQTNHKAAQFLVGDRVRITKNKNIFRKGHNKNWSREIFVKDSVLKTSPSMHEFKIQMEKNNNKLLWKRTPVEKVINELLSKIR